jgi:hypothetical protein
MNSKIIKISDTELLTLKKAMELLEDRIAFEDIHTDSEGHLFECDDQGETTTDSLNILYMTNLDSLYSKLC